MSVDQGKATPVKRTRLTNVDTWYVSLVQNVVPNAGSQPSRAIGIMSSVEKEGTSTIASNLALTAAALNLGPVLLVDANDANPTLHKTFGIEMRQGLQNALADQFSPLECVTSTQIEHLSLVVNGKLDSNETAIYSKSSIDETLSDWRDAFRIVVVDLPPANLVANGAFLAKHLDSVLLVVEAGRAQRHVVSKTSAHLQKIGVPLKGAIYNKVAKASGGIPQ